MREIPITSVSIAASGRIDVVPAGARFPFIYREATEIHWDEQTLSLYSPSEPRASLSTVDWWFLQILDAARAQDVELLIDDNTRWQVANETQRIELVAAFHKRKLHDSVA